VCYAYRTDTLEEIQRAKVLGAWDLAQFIGDMNTSLYMRFRAIREQPTVAVSGESAEEVFGGHP
jgi:asparagine synthase (glutamine-hydrolysing)